MIERERYLEAVASEASALLAAASEGFDRRVPTCPDWDVRKLVRHVQRLWSWVGETAERVPEPVEWGSLPRPTVDDDDLLDLAGEAAERVVGALRAADPDGAIQSWSGEVTTMWWCRRLAHETAVHRQDAQLAAGEGAAVDALPADLAVDGVDEALSLFLPLAYRADGFGSPASVHVHATDAEGEWVVRLADGVAVTREHAKGDVAVRGTASDLFSVLWHRRDPSAVELLGDADVFTRLLPYTCV
jgi:uncharacterized protein (TIGR03083 family)